VCDGFQELISLYNNVWKSKDPNSRDYFKAKAELAKRYFRERLLAVTQVAPDRHLEALRGLQEQGLAYLRAAGEAADLKQDRTEDLEDLLKAFEKDFTALLASLKE
jgi:hypothetical protein